MRGCVATGVLVLLAAGGAHAQQRGEITAEAIARHAQQVSTLWTQRAQAMASAIDGMLEAERAALTGREEARALVAHSPSEGVCEAVEGARAASGTRAAREQEAGEAAAALVAWLVRDTARAPGMSAASDATARLELVLSRYCAPGRTAVGEGSDCRAAPALHAADLDPGAVFGVATFENEDQALVAVDWARNVTMPVADTGQAWRGVDTALQRRVVLERRASEARAALAAGYVQERLAARLPAVSAGSWAQAIGVAGADDETGRMSTHALLGTLVRGRFENPEVFLRLQAQDESNLLRELIVNEAVSLALSFEAYRDEERQGAVLAARLARAVEWAREL